MTEQIDDGDRKISELTVSELRELIKSVVKETVDDTLKRFGLR